MAIPTYKKIASVTVGAGGATSMEFTNIPNTYTDLLIKTSARSSTSDGSYYITFNGVTSSYSWRRLLGSGSAASSQSGTDNYAALIQRSTDTASTFGSNEIYIPNYTGSTNKSYSIDAILENNATDALSMLLAGFWSNTSIINSIKLTGAASFVQYSSAVLYGIVRSN